MRNPLLVDGGARPVINPCGCLINAKRINRSAQNLPEQRCCRGPSGGSWLLSVNPCHGKRNPLVKSRVNLRRCRHWRHVTSVEAIREMQDERLVAIQSWASRHVTTIHLEAIEFYAKLNTYIPLSDILVP